LDGVAEKDEGEGEDETPADDRCHAETDPVADVDCEHAHVEKELAEF
jgi:hypothetical protein